MTVTSNISESVSVIIPFYNSSSTLRRALTSVYCQSIQVIEVIVVNDCSSNKETELALSIIADFARVRVIHHNRNMGPSAARNSGIREAVGSFIALLDSDDFWMEDKLRICLSTMNNLGVDFLGHNTTVGSISRPSLIDMLHGFQAVYRINRLDIYISTSQFAPSTVVFRKGAMPVIFDESIYLSEDYRLWGELVFLGYRLYKLKKCLSVRDEPHIKGNGLTGNVDRLRSAHILTHTYFVQRGYVGALLGQMATIFLKLKYIRHR
ncbi:glycosyltransferase family 2 protein [Methylosinus sp. LW4]|uniref:glycosyltransferase family 2 protein n=1 Tax=Methylosinus sp. LW4 TaxID=136993 RepID=UPI0009FF3976